MRPRRPRTVIFDLDTTVLTVYGRQGRSAVGFNPKKRGRPSYLPLLCFEGGTGDVFYGSYHPGDTHPCSVIEALLEERNQARASKDFAASDRIRDALTAAGVILEDGAGGTTWRRQ